MIATTAPAAFTFGPAGLAFGTIIASTPPAAIVAVSTPVYPADSPAGRNQRAYPADASVRFHTVAADGTERANLLHRGNSVALARSL